MKTHLFAASATLAAVLFAGGAPAQAACDPATRAIQYLAANQLPDGSLDMSSAGGFGNPNASEQMAIGVAAAGYDPNTITRSGKSVYDYLAANSAAATNSVGRAATLVLALAAGNTPTARYNLDDFGGVHPLTVVNAAYHASGPNAGAFGDGSTFGQALSILALRAAGQTPPPAALTWLESTRNTGRSPGSGGYTAELPTDTGWNYGNAADQHQGDTNTTSLALQALDAAGDHSQDAAGLAFLHDQQNPDGGFPLEKPSAFGTASDADSDALGLEAITATGQPLNTFTVGGNTPLSNLLSMQDAASGGFSGGAPDTFTTSQVPQGLAGAALPVSPPTAGRAVPAAGCPAPSVTGATASPIASPVPRLPAAGAGRSAVPPRGAVPLPFLVLWLAAGVAAALPAARES
jgi:hypothetical protein